MDRNDFGRIPDDLWQELSARLPQQIRGQKGGRPRIADRQVITGIVYRLRTGCQCKAIPTQFGSGSTCHRRFQQWQQAGGFRAIFAALVGYDDRARGIDWRWASLDSAMAKSPKGGDCTGPNPTDRAKLGVKRHVLSVPVAIGITAANVHDKRLAEPMMDAVVVRDGPAVVRPTNLCLDKGSDYPDVDAAIRARGIVPHIRRRGETRRSR